MHTLMDRLFELRILVFAAIVVALVMLFGCATQTSLKIVATQGFAVDRAMTAAGMLHKNGIIDDDAKYRLIRLHAEWQPIWAATYRALKDDSKATVPPELQEKADALFNAAKEEGVVTP